MTLTLIPVRQNMIRATGDKVPRGQQLERDAFHLEALYPGTWSGQNQEPLRRGRRGQCGQGIEVGAWGECQGLVWAAASTVASHLLPRSFLCCASELTHPWWLPWSWWPSGL